MPAPVKPNPDDPKYQGADGIAQYEKDESAYRKALRDAGTPDAAARQGAVKPGLEAVPSSGIGAVRRDPGAAGAPIGDVSGTSTAVPIAGGPDPADPKYQGMAGKILFSKDTAAYRRKVADDELVKKNRAQMGKQ